MSKRWVCRFCGRKYKSVDRFLYHRCADMLRASIGAAIDEGDKDAIKKAVENPERFADEVMAGHSEEDR